MKNADSILTVARHLRHEAMTEIARDIRRLQERGKDYESMGDGPCIDNFFPFVKEVRADGVFVCKGGSTIFDATKAAGMLADLTNETVSFDHNGNLHAENPRKWQKPE